MGMEMVGQHFTLIATLKMTVLDLQLIFLVIDGKTQTRVPACQHPLSLYHINARETKEGFLWLHIFWRATQHLTGYISRCR